MELWKLLKQNNTLLGLLIASFPLGGFLAGIIGLDPALGFLLPAAILAFIYFKDDGS